MKSLLSFVGFALQSKNLNWQMVFMLLFYEILNLEANSCNELFKRGKDLHCAQQIHGVTIQYCLFIVISIYLLVISKVFNY